MTYLDHLEELTSKATPGPWAATTEHDCWGHYPPKEPHKVRWCVYDPGEDDPPIGEGFIGREDAELVAAAITALPILLEIARAAERCLGEVPTAVCDRCYDADCVGAEPPHVCPCYDEVEGTQTCHERLWHGRLHLRAALARLEALGDGS